MTATYGLETHKTPARNMQIEVPRPRNPRPIVSIGAGGIVRDAHLPAYKKAGFPVVAIADLDKSKAENLARAFGIPAVRSGVAEAAPYPPTPPAFYLPLPAS